MALSNWAALGIDDEGKASTATFASFNGVRLEIYKSWVYLASEEIQFQRQSFSRPTFAQIEQGELTVNDLNIKAARIPDAMNVNGVFVFAASSRFENGQLESRRFAGIGCYGYDDELPRIAAAMGVNLSQWDDAWSSNLYSPEGDFFNLYLSRGEGDALVTQELQMPYDASLESQYVGVTPATLAAFRDWLHEAADTEADTEWIARIDFDNLLQYNAGDRFFAHHAGAPVTGTPVGQPTEPLLSQMLKKPDGEQE